MIELIVGIVLGEMLAARWGWQPTEALALGLVFGGMAYAASCAIRPYRRCPWWWCSTRNPKAYDSRGNYRIRAACWVCGGEPWRRIGARLIGRG